MTAADRQPEVSPGGRLHAPATLRNRTPIAAVLARWLPSEGLVVELARGTGEHVPPFAAAFPHLVLRSAASRVGHETGSTFRHRLAPAPSNKNNKTYAKTQPKK